MVIAVPSVPNLLGISFWKVCGLLTPLHIVPEWYFLWQYAMLKAIPNKNAGFIILLTSIFILFYFGEIRILIIFIRLMDYNNSFSIIFLLFIFLLFLWIGAQFPLEKFLSYGRILIFYYYSVCVCVLLSRPSNRINYWKREFYWQIFYLYSSTNIEICFLNFIFSISCIYIINAFINWWT